MAFEYFSKNGELRPVTEAVVPLSNIEYSYGFGVYETIRVNNGVPFFLPQHMERLQHSAKLIELEHTCSDEFVTKAVLDLVEKCGPSTYNLKLMLIGATKAEGAQLFIEAHNPFFPDKKLYEDGAKFVTYKYEREIPQAKSLNMLMSYLAYREAKRAGAYDTLLIDNDGYVREGTRTNFLCIKDKTLYSAPREKILEGVMRMAVLKVARDNGFEFVERDIPLESITEFDNTFVTSTSSKIMPACTIDAAPQKSVSPALRELMQKLNEFLDSSQGTL